MDHSQILNLIPELIKLSLEVSEVVMAHYKNGYEIKNKTDESPVTSADLASNELIISRLNELTPSIFIVSEETESTADTVRLNKEWVWCIDPLDGTKEFIAGNGEFSVNIALLHFGNPVLGFVVLPYFNKTYYAVKDKGAFIIDPKGTIRRIDNSIGHTRQVIRAVTSRSHHNPVTKDILNSKYEEINWIPLGSSLKFTELAEGRADVYLKIGKTMEWDIAAPQIILEESGGKILSFPELKSLKYNKKNLENPDFIAWRMSFNF